MSCNDRLLVGGITIYKPNKLTLTKKREKGKFSLHTRQVISKKIDNLEPLFLISFCCVFLYFLYYLFQLTYISHSLSTYLLIPISSYLSPHTYLHIYLHLPPIPNCLAICLFTSSYNRRISRANFCSREAKTKITIKASF